MVKHDNIPGFWGYYVSPKGIIWTIRSRNGRGKAKFWRKVNPTISHKGRLQVQLRKNGKVYKYQVSQLVAIAHIPNPENKPLVMHLDNNPQNNHFSNLKWGTQSENMQQMVAKNRSGSLFKSGKDNIVYKKNKITPRTGPKFTTFEIFWVRLLKLLKQMLKQMGFSTVFISKIDGRSRKNLSRYLKDL